MRENRIIKANKTSLLWRAGKYGTSLRIMSEPTAERSKAAIDVL